MGSKIEKLGIGIVFAAIGEQYVQEACNSARSCKLHMPNVPILLFTETEIKEGPFDDVQVLKRPAPGFKGIKLYKPYALGKSPFDITLFLDSDTYVCDSILELFDMAYRADFLMALDTADMSLPRVDGQELPNFYPYNSGVICFRKTNKTMQTLIDWSKILDKEFDEHQWDQRALMASILINKAQVHALHPIYNCRTNFIVSLPQVAVKVIHGRGINFQETANELNREMKNRVWMPKRRKAILKKKRGPLRTLYEKTLQRLKS